MVAAAYVPDAGHIIKIDLDPRKGHEQAGWRPALILSPKIYKTKRPDLQWWFRLLIKQKVILSKSRFQGTSRPPESFWPMRSKALTGTPARRNTPTPRHQQL